MKTVRIAVMVQFRQEVAHEHKDPSLNKLRFLAYELQTFSAFWDV